MSDDTKREVQRWRELAEKARLEPDDSGDSLCGHADNWLDGSSGVPGICWDCHNMLVRDAVPRLCDLVEALTARAEKAEARITAAAIPVRDASAHITGDAWAIQRLALARQILEET